MKIGIIGAGGIGSYLVRALNELEKTLQLKDCVITVFDDDVVEESNILYQDYNVEDILEFKADALSKKYNIISKPYKVESIEDLKEFDLIVSCVDNTKFRRMVFNHYDELPDFIDLRSEGKSYAVFTKIGNSKENLLKTLPEHDVENGSCQLKVDKEKNIIQQGNKIVAIIGSQVILDRARNIDSSLRLIQSI